MGRDVARTWLQRGQSLEAAGQFPTALEAYDAAIAILTHAMSGGTKAAESPELIRELGIAWMNRGNAAQKIGTVPSVAESVQAYDHAIAHFSALPPHPSGPRRGHLGAAWLNRGHALLLANDATAITSFENAIAILTPLPPDNDPFVRRNLAGALTNLAHVLLTLAREGRAGPALARGLALPRGAAPAATNKLDHYKADPTRLALLRSAQSARDALSSIDGYEHQHLDFATMSLRARRALVMALGALLVDAAAAGMATAELIAEASDTIEEGLALSLSLGPAGFRELRPLTESLFRLGVQLYGAHQPHFLGEFVLDLMASPSFAEDTTFCDIAHNALGEALTQWRRPRFFVAGTPAGDRELLTVRSLRSAQDELARRLPRTTPDPHC